MIKQVMPFVVGLFLCSSVYAQVPKQINYQGIARNAYGAPLSNQSVSIRVSIHEASPTGIIVYSERRTVTTNQFGLFSTAIGSEGGSNLTGTLSGVNWSATTLKYVEIEMDPKGGTNFVSLGSSPLTSVPFAFRAESANPIGAAGGDLSGNFPNPAIKDGAVTSTKLGTGAVTADKIPDGSITAAKLAPGVLSGSSASGAASGDLTGTYPAPSIAAGAVTSGKLANAAITTNKIADGSVTAAKLASGVIPTSLPPTGAAAGDLTGTYPNPSIANAAVTNGKIADNAISTAKVQDASITNPKLADNAVTAAKIADGTITATKLAPGVIPSGGSGSPTGAAGGDLAGTYPNPTVANNAVTNGKIADNAISTTKVLDAAITNPKLADNAVSTAKIADNAVTTAKIADGTVASADLAANAVTTAKLADGSVTAVKIPDGTITSAKLASGVIPSSLPPSGAASGDLSGNYPAPTVGKLNGYTLAATAPVSGQILKFNGTQWAPANEASGGSGSPTGAAGGDLTGSYPNPTVANNAITSAKIADASIGTAKLADGAVTSAKIASGVIPTSLPPNGTASGDLSGSYPSPAVAKINGVAVAATLPTTGQILKYNGTQWAPAAEATGGSGAPTGAAGGDLAGSYPNPTIAANAITAAKMADAVVSTAKLADGAVTAAKITDGTITSAKLATGVIPTSLPPNGAASGDLAGTYPNPTLGKIAGTPISSVAPTTGQVLKFNGTQWAPQADATGSGTSFSIPFPTPASTKYTDNSNLFSLYNYGPGIPIVGSNANAALVSGVNGNIEHASPNANSSGVWGAVTGTSSTNAFGVIGTHSGMGTAVAGFTNNGIGVKASSINNIGLSAYSQNQVAIEATSDAGTGLHVVTHADGGSALPAIQAEADQTTAIIAIGAINGIEATSTVPYGAGLYANNSGLGTAIVGETAGDGSPAIYGYNAATGSPAGRTNAIGVMGTSSDGIGVMAYANEVTGSGNGTALLAALGVAGTGNLAEFQVGGTNVARIDANGRGYFNGGAQYSGADVAEHFSVEGSLTTYEPGDVLEISASNDRTVVKSSKPYSTLVAGVYATKPGVLLTEKNINEKLGDAGVPMGVIGVIPTKVTMEGGAIKRGDLLVSSSTPGAAMKADPDKVKVGQVIGKALADFNGAGIGKINVLVSVK